MMMHHQPTSAESRRASRPWNWNARLLLLMNICDAFAISISNREWSRRLCHRRRPQIRPLSLPCVLLLKHFSIPTSIQQPSIHPFIYPTVTPPTHTSIHIPLPAPILSFCEASTIVVKRRITAAAQLQQSPQSIGSAVGTLSVPFSLILRLSDSLADACFVLLLVCASHTHVH